MSQRRRSLWATVCVLVVLVFPAALPGAVPVALAATNSVTIAGSLQSELGCPGDWQPDCASTHIAYDANDDVWQGTFNVPAGGYEYKAVINDAWSESYGANGGGDNIPLNLATDTNVKFYFDDKNNWITSNANSVIAVAPGNFQSELGCPGDWDPSCLRSWLQDVDGDGIYLFETTGLPAGTYEGKVALNEGWDVNYGQGGVLNGSNLSFIVPTDNAKVSFRYDSVSHVLSIQAGHGADNNVEWDGVRHDSRDTLYRTPGGAVVAGTPVTLRLRTFHNDVTSATLRIYDVNASGQRLVPMTPAATDVPCFQSNLAAESCDFWEATVTQANPNNFWYRFILTDGSDTDYYADNTGALDGGVGSATDDAVDTSFALMFYSANFKSPSWARNAVIYQIFPDRFRNGNRANDPRTGDPRYDDPMIALPWGTLPEGYCRNYADAATNCPWRFDDTPPDWSPGKEGPRGRDYYGGDLRGVMQQLLYLKSLGITAIYFNPIFYAKSNHRYDTYDFMQIDPALGTLRDFQILAKAAKLLGMKIIVDGVYNHMSSDSPLFDRYGASATVGACESGASAYRSWFVFRAPAGAEPAPCAPSTAGGNDTYYVGWFGFDSIPEIRKTNPEVQSYFLTAPNSVSRYWLRQGAGGWRMDVMGDASFPAGFWETFRQVVRETDPEAVIIGELWQKDTTLLRNLRGETADTTMNYRMRDAILGLLVPSTFDSKGFGDSGRVIAPSEFASRMLSIREDYPDAAYYSLMNLVDSHDTERVLWTLTPGQETIADKELNTANLNEGKRRLQLTSLIQFAMPGAPTIYYGDEVGVTGDDDPDDRRTYPWRDKGGNPDNVLLAHYRAMSKMRADYSVLRGGDIRLLLADDTNNVVAMGRRSASNAAIMLINRSNTSQLVRVPVGGFLPDGALLKSIGTVANSISGTIAVSGGYVEITLNALSGVVLHSKGGQDLYAPRAPRGLTVTETGNGYVNLNWTATSGAAGYNIYRSVVRGGGYQKINISPVSAATYNDTGLRNARDYYYVVKTLDAAGNESTASNEALGTPKYIIGWANLQWPPSISHEISVVNRTQDVYGQVWIDGVTNQPGRTESLRAQLGYGPDGSNPASATSWNWVEASFNGDAGNNDEFKASLLPEQIGNFDYAYRYSTDNGRSWIYADLNGIGDGYSVAEAGALQVNASADTTAPAIPANLVKVAASPVSIDLAWDAVIGDTSLYGYEVLRSSAAGGPYTQIARVTGATYSDTSVSEGATYYYVVRALDTAFNRSGNSTEVSATALLRTVTLTFNVTVPTPSGAAISRSVYIAGFLDRLDGGLPQWNPGGVVLTKVNDTLWQITLTGKEGTQLEYKYALGAWDYVEKDGACGETANRTLTLTYGSNGNQTVNDTIANWRNVLPCGN